MPLESITGENLVKTIIRSLEELNIDLNYQCGEGYNGAAAMSSRFRGAQACIAQHYPTARYIHCVSHSLNQAVSNISEVRSIRNCFGIIEKVYTFLLLKGRKF